MLENVRGAALYIGWARLNMNSSYLGPLGIHCRCATKSRVPIYCRLYDSKSLKVGRQRWSFRWSSVRIRCRNGSGQALSWTKRPTTPLTLISALSRWKQMANLLSIWFLLLSWLQGTLNELNGKFCVSLKKVWVEEEAYKLRSWSSGLFCTLFDFLLWYICVCAFHEPLIWFYSLTTKFTMKEIVLSPKHFQVSQTACGKRGAFLPPVTCMQGINSPCGNEKLIFWSPGLYLRRSSRSPRLYPLHA